MKVIMLSVFEQIEQENRRPHLITWSPAHLIKCSVFGLSAKNGEGGIRFAHLL